MRISTWLRPLIVRLSRSRRRRLSQCPAFRPRLEVLEDRITPSGGGLLDPTFGSGGTALHTTGTNNQALTDVTVLPDGKLLTAGYIRVNNSDYNRDFAAARYNADGTLDTSFGSGGVATFNLSKFGDDTAMAAAIQPGTGKILLAGTIAGQFGLIRLNLDGTLDTTFGAKGSGGEATASPKSHAANYASSMVVLPDGKILLAGLVFGPASSADGSLALARFNANGTLDATFGNKGTVLTTITGRDSNNTLFHPVNVAVDSNGRIIVAATHPVSGSESDFLVARFNANGSLDTTFGPAHTGVVTTDLAYEDEAYALTLQSDGKIVVGGWAVPATGLEAPAGVVRYNSDGSLDQTFGAGGMALIDADPGRLSTTVVRAAVVQPDGKILLAADGGSYTPNGNGSYDFSGNMVEMIRLNANGTPDGTYGPAGTGGISIPIDYNDEVSAMALQPDGRAVVAGEMNTNPSNPSGEVASFALMRFLGPAPSPSPVQIGSLTATPNPVAAGSPVTLTAGGVTTTNAGATVTEVAFYAVNDAGLAIFLGNSIQNPDGTWTLTLTPKLASGQYTLLALAVDSSGSISDPLAVPLDVQ